MEGEELLSCQRVLFSNLWALGFFWPLKDSLWEHKTYAHITYHIYVCTFASLPYTSWIL